MLSGLDALIEVASDDGRLEAQAAKELETTRGSGGEIETRRAHDSKHSSVARRGIPRTVPRGSPFATPV
jgi:hypothetical protein